MAENEDDMSFLVRPRLLTETEAANLLGLSPRTLQKWRHTGRPPKYLKLGGAVRYIRKDLDAFLVAARQSSKSADDNVA